MHRVDFPLTLSIIALVVAILVAVATCSVHAREWIKGDCAALLKVIQDRDAPPRIKAMAAGKMSDLKCPERPWR